MLCQHASVASSHPLEIACRPDHYQITDIRGSSIADDHQELARLQGTSSSAAGPWDKSSLPAPSRITFDAHEHEARHTAAISTPSRPTFPRQGHRLAQSVFSSLGRWNTGVVSVDMPFTGDSRPGRAPETAFGARIAGWWIGSGSSGAENAISNAMSREDSLVSGAVDQSPPNRQRRVHPYASDTLLSKSTSTTNASRLALFSSPISTISKFAKQDGDSALGDELCNLSVEEALYSYTSPSDRDTFSPAAFKNFQMNAVGLLTKLQNAYREQAISLKDLRAEREARTDELEEVETRARHLKLQLEGMARKVSEQEQAMRQLLGELAAEKKARVEERAARENGASLVKDHPTSEGSVSEDLGAEEDQQRRQWIKGGEKSDAGFDTDEESFEDGSVFSSSRSPTVAPSVFDGNATEMPIQTTQTTKAVIAAPPRRPRSSQQMSTFQKLLKGISGEVAKGREPPTATDKCANCEGQDATVAWDTVRLLRDENVGLKQRVAQLETAIGGALDAVDGIGM